MKDDNDSFENQLKSQQVKDKMPDKEKFWQEFKSRAKTISRDGKPDVVKLPFPVFKYLKIAACFSLIAIAVWAYTLYNKSGNTKNGKENTRVSIIENYEFFTPNKGVMIWQDDDEAKQSSATILWVIDSEEKKAEEYKNET